MTESLLFPRFDGLMHLSRREGVDVRPTLLRVLTDLYVQSPTHSEEETQQFSELATRLIDEVDDATRAAISARLSIYPGTPPSVAAKLALNVAPAAAESEPDAAPDERAGQAAPAPRATPPAPRRTIGMQPSDASAIDEMFFAATSAERAQILDNLRDSPIAPAARGDAALREAAVAALEKAAFAADRAGFTRTLADALRLPDRLAAQIVDDAGGEALACAVTTLGMPLAVYERVLMFLDPKVGASVITVYRLSRFYEKISERAALIMLSVWRGAAVARVRARHQASLYDDERRRARSAPATTSTTAPGQARTETAQPQAASVTSLRG